MAAAIGIILLKLAILVLVAKLAGELAERLRQPAVLGELFAGVLLGPSLFGLVDLNAADPSAALITFVASLGAIVLLLEVGLETKVRDLLTVGPSAGLVAFLGIFAAFAAGFGASYGLARLGVWPHSWIFHIFLGATFTATSVGITARVLSDMGRLATPEARTILGAAVLDDVGGLLILAIVSSLAAGALDPGALALKAAFAIGFLILALVVGVRFAPRVLDVLGRARVRGLLFAVAFAFALLMAFMAELTGLAAIVGAFAAGLILAQTRQQHALHERVRSLSDVLVPIFFVYVGLQVDLRGIGWDIGPMLLASAVLTVAGLAGKLVAGLGVIDKSISRLAVGVGMVPRGEVGLIFALVGATTLVGGVPLLSGWAYTAVLLAIAITTFLTPIWLKRVLADHPTSVTDFGPVVADTDAQSAAVLRPRGEPERKAPDRTGKG